MDIHQGLLGFNIELIDRAEALTAHAGLPLVVETALAALPTAAYRTLRDALGYASWKVVRRHLLSLVTVVTAGGEHLSDLETLRADRGLCAMLGFTLSSPTQAKDFLYRFHQARHGRLLLDEDDDLLSVRGTAQIRAEGPGLRALDAMVLRVVEAVQAVRPRSRATLDVDASIIEAHKRRALVAYEKTVGYQPQMAFWAEQRVWVCDQFRDGHVPAEFTVKAIGEERWKPYRSLNERAGASEERQCAEVEDFVPDWKRNFKKEGEPFRYIAIRVRSRQREMFEADEVQWRHFAVVTNMDWEGERLLRWQREKQGTVEYGHGVLKNDLGGGVLPSGRFGANAAWWRLNVLVHNLLELLRAQALPEELGAARPKTLRFVLFNVAGRVVHHAREWTLKLYRGVPWAAALVRARQLLVALVDRLEREGAEAS
jgi:hypothetical protein